MTQTIGTPLPWESEPYSIKRHGLSITNCDSEPVHTPGCVQAHGALLVVRLADLRILQASDNAQSLLGHAAGELLGQSVAAVVGQGGIDLLKALLAKEQLERNPMHLMTLPRAEARAKAGIVAPFDVSFHTIDGVGVLEFESTGRTGAGEPDYYALVKKTVTRLQGAKSLAQFCTLVTAEVRQLTGLDRVMVYKFHADGHGEVIAESKRGDLDPWLGLHYPAEDIPKPAREIFTRTWIRPVPDVSDALAELVPLVNPDTGQALNMTFCALRGTSNMYSEYLRNMGVAAALTMAIRSNDNLWGLIACHHYAGPKHVPYQVRAACEFLAQVVTLQHQAAEAKEHDAYRANIERVHQQLLATAGTAGSLGGFTGETLSLLDAIHAGGVALYHGEQWSLKGTTPDSAQLDNLKNWLMDTWLVPGAHLPYATDHLAQPYPDAARFASVASGLMALPVSLSEQSLLLWFRPETLHTVKWGGNPHDKPVVFGPNGPRLSPRHSFEMFSESVRGRSLPWLAVETEAAASLRMAMLDVLASQVAQRMDVNHNMARSNEELDAFAYVASHDLKEPLRGIHQYANQLLQDAALVGDESRAKLDRMVQLTVRMDTLLDGLLHFSRVGGGDAAPKLVDLNKTLGEALEMVGFRTDQGSSVHVPRQLPRARCNETQCRQIFVNLLSNALKYSDRAQKRIEIGYIDPSETHSRPGCLQGCASETIFYVADNGVGIDAKHFTQIFKLFKRLHGHSDYGGGAGAGLAIVDKLVELHGGKVWVYSLPGEGATFYFTLPGRAASAHEGAHHKAPTT
jgi:chemotaxis family two-component system sensor kinase Cph1